MQKRFYPYEYANDWVKFNETSLPGKEDFKNHLNIEDFTDADCAHIKRVSKDFEIHYLGEYHDLMFKAMHYCWLMYFKSLELCFLKKTKAKLDVLNDIDMLIMVEKGIRGGICHSIYRYEKTNNKSMKDYDKNKESSCLKYQDVNNLYGWTIS